MDNRKLLSRYVAPQKARVGLLAGLLGATVALPLINPQIVRAFIDRAVGTSRGPLVPLAAAYIAIALAIQVLSIATNYQSGHVGWTATNRLRADLARHALHLDMPYHNRRTPGEMIERVDGDVTALSNFLSQFVMSVLWAVLLLGGVLIAVFMVDRTVGAALTAFTVVAGLVIVRLRQVAVPASTAQREQSARLFGFLEERLNGLRDVRALGAGRWVMRGFAEQSREHYRSAMHAERAGSAFWCSMTLVFAIGHVISLGLGAWLFLRGRITIGTVYLIEQYMLMIRDPLETIGDQLRDFQKAAAGAARVHQLFGERAGITDGTRSAIPDGPLCVDLDHVTFAYNDGDPVLRDVDLHLPAGGVLGVLGRTGSGKTTLARLLLRLYDVRDGAVRLGDIDVRNATLADVRTRVGYVTQDVELFRATVRDNLTLFHGGSDDTLRAVLDELGLGAWLRSLPDGLDTVMDGGLSAGESQLLAFARVFLRSPGLVILDEASSRLDPATERRMELAVDRLLDGRTGILIAHRLETVRRCDAIAIFEHGRIIEHGPRTELEADPGSRYSQLLRTGLEEVMA